MIEKNTITGLLHELNDELCAMGVKGEVCLYGGAVMCVVYDARPATKDIDAVFRPAEAVRTAAQRVAQAHGLPDTWLNDAVKGFVVQHPQRVFAEMPCLKVFVPEPDYLLAMKVLAARVEATDKDDVVFLVRRLNLKSPEEVFRIVEHYYPENLIKPATRFFIEELFQA